MRLHDYQKAARAFILKRLEVEDGAGLWLDPGLGKTAVTLHAIMMLKLLYGLKQTTIVAPSRVLETAWPVEVENWKLPLTCAWIRGDEDERQAALDAKADLVFLSCESLAKCEVDNGFSGDGFQVTFKKKKLHLTFDDGRVGQFDSVAKLIKAHPECESLRKKRFRYREQMPLWLDRVKFRNDLLVIDESTKFRNWSAARTKYLRKLVERHPKRITLTGTPVPANLGEDLFPQQFILDRGKTLGTGIVKFREQWMRSCGFENRDWEMVPGLIPEFLKVISPWYLRQEITDYLDMPKIVRKEIFVKLPDAAMAKYKKFEKEMYIELEKNELVALNGGGKYNLCRQIAGGSAYDREKDIAHIHDAKLDALEDLVDELNGKPLLVAYCFTHELLKLKKRWPKIAHFGDGRSTTEIIKDWKAGKIKILAAQCQSISHGVNGLQSGNDLCWFTLTDDPDVREQFECRIYRQGVEGQVRFYYLMAKGTVDTKIKRVLDQKGATQRDVLKAVKDGAKALEAV